jgi:hypothetical protein
MVAWIAVVLGSGFVLVGLILAIAGRETMNNPKQSGTTLEDVGNFIIWGPLGRLIGWLVMFFGAIIALIGLGVLASS